MEWINAGVTSASFFGVDLLDAAMDDGSPYSVQDVELVGVGGNAAGNMIYYTKPTLAMVTVNVNARHSGTLFGYLVEARTPGAEPHKGEFTVDTMQGPLYNYSDGMLIAGGGGQMQADGKMGAASFTAAFYSISG